MEFKIGDRVKVKTYYTLPEGDRTKGMAKVAGKEGEIVDKLYSEAKGCTVYKIHIDGYERRSTCDFTEDCISPARGNCEYAYEFEFLENLVVARLYEIEDGIKTEIAKGHAHIFHDGVYGIAQASSYALKRIAMNLNDGSLREYEND